MIYERKAITLKNGEQCILKSPTAEDAEALLRYRRRTAGETRNLMHCKDEINMDAEEEEAILLDVGTDPASCMISAWVGGELSGNAGITPVMSLDKLRHRGKFRIAVKKKFWHMGIGTALLAASIEAAREMDYEQLELEVVDGNTPAVELYERFGFVSYGRRPNGTKFRDGGYADDILMVLSLKEKS
ncbi:MAG: GNAT family N-acetyltransferase [Clostridia bacterium]|nr:GNAT family N-acetyltransferase [Clostridia bacterium]